MAHNPAIEPRAVATHRPHPPHLVAFDRDHSVSELPAAEQAPPPAPPALVEEFLWVLGLLDVVVGRGEHFVGTTQGVNRQSFTMRPSRPGHPEATTSRKVGLVNALTGCFSGDQPRRRGGSSRSVALVTAARPGLM
jgi:hypothetical protein